MSGWIEREREELERRLAQAVPEETTAPERLHRAMRYSLLGGGKRLRPLLCRAAAEAVAGAAVEAAWRPAVAIEMVHAYSLIHDDLPALDNDVLRRGRPTAHAAFGEATAILAGDALLTLALGHLAEGARGGDMVVLLAEAAGTPAGMVAGQAADMAANSAASAAEVRAIHLRKTAALIRASLELGGLAAAAAPEQQRTLRDAGERLGLAFQIADDLLDCTATSSELGKTAGKDQAQRKATYPAAVGLAAAGEELERLAALSQAALADWGAHAAPLRALVASVGARARP
ncbi:MAG: polyprenyl synthetase family protein [Terriglobales bacterium]